MKKRITNNPKIELTIMEVWRVLSAFSIAFNSGVFSEKEEAKMIRIADKFHKARTQWYRNEEKLAKLSIKKR